MGMYGRKRNRFYTVIAAAAVGMAVSACAGKAPEPDMTQQENGEEEALTQKERTEEPSFSPVLPEMQQLANLDYYNFLLYLPETAAYAYVDSGWGGQSVYYLLLITDRVYEADGKWYATVCDVYYQTYDNREDMIPEMHYLGTIGSEKKNCPVSHGGTSFYAAGEQAVKVFEVDLYDRCMTGIRVEEAAADYSDVWKAYESSMPVAFSLKSDSGLPTPLEDAIRRNLPWTERDGVDYCTVSLITLGVEEKEQESTWYGMVRMCEFSLSDGIEEVGGYHMPMAFTFDITDHIYSLKEKWQPREGSYYVESIRKRFPEEIAQKVIDTQNTAYQQDMDCYERLISFKELDTETEIQRRLSQIISSPMESSDPADYVKAHEKEYRELIYMGEYTLAYYEKGDKDAGGLEEKILEMACEKIREIKDTGADF